LLEGVDKLVGESKANSKKSACVFETLFTSKNDFFGVEATIINKKLLRNMFVFKWRQRPFVFAFSQGSSAQI